MNDTFFFLPFATGFLFVCLFLPGNSWPALLGEYIPAHACKYEKRFLPVQLAFTLMELFKILP